MDSCNLPPRGFTPEREIDRIRLTNLTSKGG